MKYSIFFPPVFFPFQFTQELSSSPLAGSSWLFILSRASPARSESLLSFPSLPQLQDEDGSSDLLLFFFELISSPVPVPLILDSGLLSRWPPSFFRSKHFGASVRPSPPALPASLILFFSAFNGLLLQKVSSSFLSHPSMSTSSVFTSDCIRTGNCFLLLFHDLPK